MSKLNTVALLVHLALAIVLGALLLIIPGRFLEALGWAPIDPIISRILGAALLAMAWGDWRVWRTAAKAETRAWSEVQVVFATLAAVGVLRHLVTGWWPAVVWILFVALAVYAIGWLWALIKQPR